MKNNEETLKDEYKNAQTNIERSNQFTKDLQTNLILIEKKLLQANVINIFIFSIISYLFV